MFIVVMRTCLENSLCPIKYILLESLYELEFYIPFRVKSKETKAKADREKNQVLAGKKTPET